MRQVCCVCFLGTDFADERGFIAVLSIINTLCLCNSVFVFLY